MNLYLGHTELKIIAVTGVNISGATQRRIYYKKPDETEGYWDAVEEDASAGKISYDVVNGDLDQVGTWTMWAQVTFNSAKVGIGQPFNVRILNPGE